MGKKPKGFGKPVAPPQKKAKPSPKLYSLTLNPLPDCEFLWQKEGRLRQIFESSEIPIASLESLEQYRQHLIQVLPSGMDLSIDEALTWETPYLYGSFSADDHQTQRQEQPSYLDCYQFISISTDMTLLDGIITTVQRRSDQQPFTLPLSLFRAEHSILPGQAPSEPCISLADYRLWWEHYQPFLR